LSVKKSWKEALGQD